MTPADDEPFPDDDDDDGEPDRPACPLCDGDGGDPLCDYVLPCPACGGAG